jgi:hypothetical protein
MLITIALRARAGNPGHKSLRSSQPEPPLLRGSLSCTMLARGRRLLVSPLGLLCAGQLPCRVGRLSERTAQRLMVSYGTCLPSAMSWTGWKKNQSLLSPYCVPNNVLIIYSFIQIWSCYSSMSQVPVAGEKLDPSN